MHRRTLRNAIRLFPSALCFALCPLLVAQQVGQFQDYPAPAVTPAETLFAYRSSINFCAQTELFCTHSDSTGLSTVPYDVPVNLTPVDPAAWANATIGSTLTFRVVSNVMRKMSNGSSYADVRARAGTLIEAKVIRVRQSKARTRNGRAEPRVKEVMVGKSIKLELDSFPVDHRFSGIAKNVVIWSVKGPFVVVFYPIEFVLLMIACSMGCDL